MSMCHVMRVYFWSCYIVPFIMLMYCVIYLYHVSYIYNVSCPHTMCYVCIPCIMSKCHVLCLHAMCYVYTPCVMSTYLVLCLHTLCYVYIPCVISRSVLLPLTMASVPINVMSPCTTWSFTGPISHVPPYRFLWPFGENNIILYSFSWLEQLRMWHRKLNCRCQK